MINTNEKRIQFFGLNIDLYNMNETLEKISQIIAEKKISQHVVVNVAKLVYSQKDLELKNIINSCEIVNVDGMGVILGAKAFGVNIGQRVTGIDLMENLIESSSEKNYRIYFFGAKEEIVSKIVDIYSKKYPDLQIAGYRNGYFKEDEEQMIAQDIKNSKADILFVAMGSPKKEKFLNKYVNDMQVPFVMGVGGSFDVIAGKVKRAPLWMQKYGLEWFYRLIQEPVRMGKRYCVTNSIFLFMILKELFCKKSG